MVEIDRSEDQINTPIYFTVIDSMYKDQVLQIDWLRHRVRIRGQEMKLSPTEFRLLTVLVNNAGIVLSVERLLDMVWDKTEVEHANVRAYISFLRKKLGGGPPQLIETVREFGYRYNPPDEDYRP